MKKRTLTVTVTEDDYAWLESTAKAGPFHFASTLARYLLAEVIREKKQIEEGR